MQNLSFEQVTFSPVTIENAVWLRGGQIGGALGYKDPEDSMSKIFNRNQDEFTPSMTRLIEMDTAGGKQQTRVFSLRGAHLLGMFSRTEKAKAFRKWVLDILDAEVAKSEIQLIPEKPTKKAIAGGLTTDQQDAVKALVKARVEVLPEDKRAKAAIKLWSSVKSKFGKSYKEVAPEEYTNVLSLIARVELDGELIAPEQNDDGLLNMAYAMVKMIVNLVPDQRTAIMDRLAKENHHNMQILGMFLSNKMMVA